MGKKSTSTALTSKPKTSFVEPLVGIGILTALMIVISEVAIRLFSAHALIPYTIFTGLMAFVIVQTARARNFKATTIAVVCTAALVAAAAFLHLL